MERFVRAAVGRWARTVDRPLPWRGERDPYRVLVSEVMLQQTQAARVAAAYPAFLERFPTLEALAAAEAADVLRAWGDLGYGRRALALWRTARSCGGRGLPETACELNRLPGIGPYTSRAVAAFAFGADEAVVDANVRRVVGRMYGLSKPAEVQTAAQRLLPRGRGAEWNQAMIDLGALVCRARNPRCDACPLRSRCAWRRGGVPQPPARASGPPFHRTARYARGRIVRALREAPSALTVRALIARTGLDRDRSTSALTALERDGVVHRRGGRVGLGPAP